MDIHSSKKRGSDIEENIKHFEKVAEACITTAFDRIGYLSLARGVNNFDSKAIERNYKSILENDFNYYLNLMKKEGSREDTIGKVVESVEKMIKKLDEVREEKITCLDIDKQGDVVEVIESSYNSFKALLLGLKDKVNNGDNSLSRDEDFFLKLPPIP